VTAWAWTVRGTEDASGTMFHPYSEEGVIQAELMGEALNLLINGELWWDTLDTEKPVTITIELQHGGETTRHPEAS
jgi:hypothetical protein